jgi:hypothetical protein
MPWQFAHATAVQIPECQLETSKEERKQSSINRNAKTQNLDGFQCATGRENTANSPWQIVLFISATSS